MLLYQWARISTTFKLLETWRQSTTEYSDVINFRLETVIITSWMAGLFRSSSLRRVFVDYYFYIEAAGCVEAVNCVVSALTTSAPALLNWLWIL